MADVITHQQDARVAVRALALAETCVHFVGGPRATHCAAGVCYADVLVVHEPMDVTLPASGRRDTTCRSLPCRASHNPAGAVCAKRELPDAEAAYARAVDETAAITATLDAMRLVHEAVRDAGGEAQGTMRCVRCGHDLRYAARMQPDGTVSSVGRCDTAGCVGWMT